MRGTIGQILPLWGIGNAQLSQIYPTAWEVNHSHVIKVYDDKKQMERNIRISEILSDCNISVPKDKTIAWKMGTAIARLHTAFIQCEREVDFWDNSLLKEMKGWIRENLAEGEWETVSKEEYARAVDLLESVYHYLPKQLIHRDVHFGNFLFFEGDLSGYIDFDLSQRNIRIFDLCYFLTGLLAEETDDAFTKSEWMENIKAVIAGYESMILLSEKEKIAIPWVMECIEILFVAYFMGMKDRKHANDACQVFHFIQSCENDIANSFSYSPAN